MAAFDMQQFAREWIAAWNARDLDAILRHYAEDVVFSSPTARQVTGSGLVVGKPALREYWEKALARHPQLHFELERVYEGVDGLTICYIRNGSVRVAETMTLTSPPDVLVIRGFVAHSLMTTPHSA
jgi:hypothetical protein